MALPVQLRAARLKRSTICISLAIFTLVLISFLSFGNLGDYSPVSNSICSMKKWARKEQNVPTRLQKQWADSVVPLHAPTFTTREGVVYSIPENVYRWPKMGKKMLIMDIDTRFDSQKGGMMNPTTRGKNSMVPRTGGYLNHMLYALIHGYEYRLIRAPRYVEPERTDSWVKPAIMREALKNHDFIMFLDGDAIFENLELPLEWLMSHWNITKDTIIAMAQDVDESSNYDDKGMRYWNSGVVLAQRKERTQELFRRWEDCPNDDEFSDCSRWSIPWAAEQAAFNNYIRYSYDMENDMRMLPCNEANGNTGHRGSECDGTMVSHWWHQKEFVVDKLFMQADGCTVFDLHQYFIKEKDRYFIDISDKTYPLEDVYI